jgi:nucleotide-binding universal stress UspA family protein
MPLRDIVVHLDRRSGCTARVLAAANLARQHGACLKGLYVVSHQFYTPESDYDRDYDEARNFFLNATAKSGVTAEWLYEDWGVVGIPASDVIAFHSHSTDLLVIGQPDPGRRRKQADHELPERLIVGSGRPVVVFPAESSNFQFGTKIMVAWKAGRESCRALHDATPLLRAASRVEVTAVVAGDEETLWEQASMKALDRHLARHSVEAQHLVIQGGNRSVADILLERAAGEGFDLLVVGGCSHDWHGATVLSPLGRELLTRMTLPVLFSH